MEESIGDIVAGHAKALELVCVAQSLVNHKIRFTVASRIWEPWSHNFQMLQGRSCHFDSIQQTLASDCATSDTLAAHQAK